jgi:hypothetical protein
MFTADDFQVVWFRPSKTTDLKSKHGITIKYIRCDDAGEKTKLEEACLKEGLRILFEYTAPGTPQRNGRVEQKFTTLYGQVRATMDHAGLSKKLCKGLWAECAHTATMIENMIVTPTKPVSSNSQFFEKEHPMQSLSQYIWRHWRVG